MEILTNFLQQGFGLLIEAGLVVLIIITLNILAKQIVKNIFKQSAKHDTHFLQDNFVPKILKPLRFMIWLIGLSYLFYILVLRFQVQKDFEPSFKQFRNLIIVVCTTWLCFEVKKQLQYSWVKKATYSGRRPDQSKINLMSKLASITILLVASLIFLDTLGVNIGALLAIGGVGGITLGFAAKDVFCNFFGGFMVHITKPFGVGDLIHTLDEKVYGTVEHIGFYLTRVLGTDKRPFYVPNSFFTSQIFVNATRMQNRRIKQNVGLRYEDFHLLKPIIKDIRAYLKASPEISNEQLQVVDFVEFHDSSLLLLIHAFTVPTGYVEWSQVQENVLIEVGNIIQKHGAEIAYPTSTLHIAGGPTLTGGE